MTDLHATSPRHPAPSRGPSAPPRPGIPASPAPPRAPRAASRRRRPHPSPPVPRALLRHALQPSPRVHPAGGPRDRSRLRITRPLTTGPTTTVCRVMVLPHCGHDQPATPNTRCSRSAQLAGRSGQPVGSAPPAARVTSLRGARTASSAAVQRLRARPSRRCGGACQGACGCFACRSASWLERCHRVSDTGHGCLGTPPKVCGDRACECCGDRAGWTTRIRRGPAGMSSRSSTRVAGQPGRGWARGKRAGARATRS